MKVSKSETESRSRDESSRKGEGTDVEIGGMTSVISLAFGFFEEDAGADFCFGPDVEGAETSDEDFFPADCFFDFPSDFLGASLTDGGGEEETTVTSEQTVETD